MMGALLAYIDPAPTPARSPRPMRWYEYALALLPVVLYFGGFTGIGVGSVACAVHLAMAKRWRGWRLAAACVACSAVAVALWGVLAVVMR